MAWILACTGHAKIQGARYIRFWTTSSGTFNSVGSSRDDTEWHFQLCECLRKAKFAHLQPTYSGTFNFWTFNFMYPQGFWFALGHFCFTLVFNFDNTEPLQRGGLKESQRKAKGKLKESQRKAKSILAKWRSLSRGLLVAQPTYSGTFNFWTFNFMYSIYSGLPWAIFASL